jgi:hypothetical protein
VREFIAQSQWVGARGIQAIVHPMSRISHPRGLGGMPVMLTDRVASRTIAVHQNFGAFYGERPWPKHWNDHSRVYDIFQNPDELQTISVKSLPYGWSGGSGEFYMHHNSIFRGDILLDRRAWSSQGPASYESEVRTARKLGVLNITPPRTRRQLWHDGAYRKFFRSLF